MTEIEAAVIDAAKRWLAAKEAMLAADEARDGDPVETEHEFDQAEHDLTGTVYRLLGRGPRFPVT